MPKSFYERKRSVEVMLGISDPVQRTNTYLTFLKYNPTESNITAAEASGSGYARAVVPPSVWTVDANGSVKNSSSITITSLPIGHLYTYWGLFDQATGGNLIAYDRLPFKFSKSQYFTSSFIIDANNITIVES